MSGTRPIGGGARFLLIAASAFIVLYGLKQAADLVAPILFAGMLAILLATPVRRLRKWGVPEGLAVLLVMLVATGLMIYAVAAIGGSVADFTRSLPTYEERLGDIESEVTGWFARMGLEGVVQRGVESIDAGALFKLISRTAMDTLGKIGNVVILLMILLFMLLEAGGFPAKLKRALGNAPERLEIFEQASQQISRYMAVKAWISLATGVLVWLLNVLLGNEFPLMWGMVAFLFNFIPNIGSVLAAVPAVLLLLVIKDFGSAGLLGVGYLTINMVIGTLLEPRVLGRSLGLSALVVFLSLLVWAWILGPIGMLLAVPMTVILKIGLEQTEDLRGFAVILGSGEGESERGHGN